MKHCWWCDRFKPRDIKHFGKDIKRGDGLRTICRECDRQRGKANAKKRKAKVLRAYGGETPACECCGNTTFEFLVLDHINGGGNKHRKELTSNRSTSGGHVYRWVIRNNFPSGFRVLCMNCNFSLGVYGYCPHKGDPNVQDHVPTRREEEGSHGSLQEVRP